MPYVQFSTKTKVPASYMSWFNVFTVGWQAAAVCKGTGGVSVLKGEPTTWYLSDVVDETKLVQTSMATQQCRSSCGQMELTLTG